MVTRARGKVPRSRPGRPARPIWPWLAAGALAAAALAMALYLLLSATAQKPLDLIVDLQQYPYGVPPAEFDYDATGPHGPLLSAGQPYWRVYVDRFAPSPEFVLLQAAALAEADHYPLALLRDVQARDVTLSVYVKPMGGTLAQGAGLLWRARDKDNYYAVLADALDQQVHLLKMVGGQPHELGAAPIPIGVVFEQQEPGPTWGWHC